MADLKNKPTDLSKDEFVAIFGGVYEHSPWVAEQVWNVGINADLNNINALATTMAATVARADYQVQLDLINAHPDLAGKAAVSGTLTVSSTSEQASAGLGACTAEEFEKFQKYNTAYKEKFGFPFIKAVKNSNRHEILAGFEARLQNDQQTEFKTALNEIDKIAAFRLQEL